MLLINVGAALNALLHSPPLGLLYLTAFLRNARPQTRIDILDQKITRAPDWKIVARVIEGGYGIVGLSCFTIAARHGERLARFIKQASPHTVVVLGGPHANAYRADALREPAIDFAVFGEGEQPFARLVEGLQTGGDLTAIPGLIYRQAARIIVNPPPPWLDNLDDLPLPAYDKIDLPPYWRREAFGLMGRRPYWALFTSRGCPYSCFYCHDIFGKHFRPRSPANVLAEMHFARARFGVSEFEVLDDSFNLNEERAREILERIAVELPGTRLLFPNGLRTDILTPAIIAALRRAGTYYLSFAVESASPRIQLSMGKKLNLAQMRENLDRCAAAGFFLNGFFMLGFPTETREEMEQTISFAVHSPLHIASFFLVTPFRGTPLYAMLDAGQQALAEGRLDDLHYDNPAVNLSAVGDAELRSIHKRALARFYCRPSRIGRVLRDHPRRLQAAFSFVMKIAQKMAVHRNHPVKAARTGERKERGWS